MEDQLVSESNANEKKRYEKLLLKHIKLLCELNQKRILPTLEKKYYPNQESIDICSSSGYLPGVAYLLRLSGDLTKSFETYIEILDKSVQKLLGVESGGVVDKDLNEFKENFEGAIKVCEESSELSASSKSSEDLWFRLLDHVYNTFIKCNESTRKSGSITNTREFISTCINSLLITMINFVSFPNLLTRMAEQYGELQIESLKEIFNKMLFSYMYQEKILQTAKALSSSNIKQQFEGLTKLRCRGLPITQEECSRCEKQIEPKDHVNVAAYPCGHIYHRKCIKSKMCYSCTHKEISKFHLIFRGGILGSVIAEGCKGG